MGVDEGNFMSHPSPFPDLFFSPILSLLFLCFPASLSSLIHPCLFLCICSVSFPRHNGHLRAGRGPCQIDWVIINYLGD